VSKALSFTSNLITQGQRKSPPEGYPGYNDILKSEEKTRASWPVKSAIRNEPLARIMWKAGRKKLAALAEESPAY
jgi:hypothetical protein